MGKFYILRWINVIREESIIYEFLMLTYFHKIIKYKTSHISHLSLNKTGKVKSSI